ncbi:MAG: hypothetical protein HC886_03415 [Leptolyngbyaceae cyanobacterium SM1_1_3]|nr:hypothetical protein [Leptolyngbyaceae cyanobacterium SM1_1_3]NJN02904.1 hypothetical protein [Leptolyngbyaceae cyanobacterium RM1_1_2]NJO09444.1 hypothetical protein [Leptolyngbyaceae cyanobacterium SL_1_1]
MFLDELTPLAREMFGRPVAFLGGFCSGFLRLSLGEDPVKTWLTQQTGQPVTPVATPQNGKGKGPTTISID